MKDKKDYGCDPLLNGTFRMVPSGKIVSKTEKDAILSSTRMTHQNDCFGMSWDQIEQKQGGKLKRP